MTSELSGSEEVEQRKSAADKTPIQTKTLSFIYFLVKKLNIVFNSFYGQAYKSAKTYFTLYADQILLILTNSQQQKKFSYSLQHRSANDLQVL